jgi:2'-5' RNA ligase
MRYKMSSNLSSHSFPQVYEDLGIDPQLLGCIMLNTEPLEVSDIIDEEHLYYAADPSKYKFVNGVVSETVPHVTLLFGLMRTGLELKKHVDAVLNEWTLPALGIDHVDFFESKIESEPYYCLVAKIVPSAELLEGNARLRFLPHIDTFPTYQPHITLAYIKKDEALRDTYLDLLNTRFKGKSIDPRDINYGGNSTE